MVDLGKNIEVWDRIIEAHELAKPIADRLATQLGGAEEQPIPLNPESNTERATLLFEGISGEVTASLYLTLTEFSLLGANLFPFRKKLSFEEIGGTLFSCTFIPNLSEHSVGRHRFGNLAPVHTGYIPIVGAPQFAQFSTDPLQLFTADQVRDTLDRALGEFIPALQALKDLRQ